MAHWFHRNPIKASAPVTFESIRNVATNSTSSKMLSELKMARAKLLNSLTDPSNDPKSIQQATELYLSLLHGLVNDPAQGSGDSKLRKLVMFKWTNSICGNTPTCAADSAFELTSISLNVAIWYTKYAAKQAAKGEVSMDEAKEVHTCLRTAGGMFKFVKESLMPRLGELSAEKGADTDQRVVEAYQMQCIAEAQEVTVARAVELKHKASLISALTNETSKLFTAASDSLKSVEPTKAAKWKKYLDLKAAFYQSYAYCFCGETLLDEDQCGKAIRALQESDKLYKKAEAISHEYSSTNGPGTTARPWQHPFFLKLGPIIRKKLEKANHENGFIYFHKVPAEPPELEVKATHGLASPQEFTMPAPHASWSGDTYAGFDASKAHPPPASQAASGDVKPVPEPEDSSPVKPANSSSGCVVS
ncbi:BRO1 domain-containing protein BROX-like [Stylophora pistillata]|uniref:BRO1 domain-containing protein BROX n=1 Tax=Stylophora pistillata TaxID=50429 RepID=A0A2B4RJJ0_STYPI|nr:BRO1 domain-containing protein BROX-like [Stylophora pistillata]PFX18564.1 BRO1 domain-containing protein BROX [Stylophora pistillata]